MMNHETDNRALTTTRQRRSTRRRGTVLLLVLGALAMVLILTVVYAALGKGDRQTARSVQDQQDARETLADINGYVADVIGSDPFDLVPDLTESILLEQVNFPAPLDLSMARYYRENTDAPATDFTFRSVPRLDPILANESFAVQELFKFNASGGHSTGELWLDTLPGLDPRVPNDPWLAATRPFDLGPGSKTFLSEAVYLNNPYYERALDWQQISNIAPDGRFVNIFYLREPRGGGNEGGGGDVGEGFNAPSLNLTRDPGTDEPRLGLFDENGDLQMGDNAVLGFIGLQDVTGADIPFNNETPDWNRPAHWTMFQRNMHRSIAELNRLASANDPSQSSYWAYQFADADGNGIIDSRWFELVDASRGTEVGLLPKSDRRYFIAARIIDLSSLVNVNTAADLIAAPTLATRPGEGPQEVSLFSLLNMSWHPAAIAGNDTLVGYGSGGTVSVVGAFDLPENQGGADDYAIVSGLDLGEYTQGLLGRKAYKRIRQSIINWEALPYELTPSRRGNNGIEDAGADGDTYRSSNMALFTTDLDPVERRSAYILYGSTSPGSTEGGNSRIGPFGIDDLVELLTFHGGNNPGTFTNLEQAFVSEDRTGVPELLSRSLLRSDRSLEAEVGERTFLAPGTDGLAGLAERESNRMARAAVDIRSLLTPYSGSRPLRSRVTDATGFSEINEAFRKIRLDTRVIAPTISYTAQPGLANNQAAQDTFASALLRNTFGVYTQTLAPYLDEGGWNPTPTIPGPPFLLRTQYYGHKGPELALRLAAHMSVNFRDMADAATVDLDSDGVPDTDITSFDDFTNPVQRTFFERRVDEPTSALLWLTSDPTRRDTARAAKPDAAAVGLIEAIEDRGFVLDADELYNGTPVLDNLPATDPNVAASSDAMIVYGVEAQPFLSEVVFMNAFFDSPRGDPFTGDDFDTKTGAEDLTMIDPTDVSEYRLTTPPRGDGLHSSGMVSIDPTINIAGRGGNTDFLFQLVAFQLFNPFDVPVRLNDMYIEFGNTFYRFSDFDGPTSLVIEPRETIVAYATNPGLNLNNPGDQTLLLSGVQDRLNDAAAAVGGTVTAADFADILDAQFGVAGAGITPRRLPLKRFDSGLIEIPETALDSDLLDGDLDTAARASLNANRFVMLWRDLGGPDNKGDLTQWDLADRRDDVMLDRLADDRQVPAAAPILDQRLRLEAKVIPETVDPITSAIIVPQFVVENALNGHIPGDTVGEAPGLSTAIRNFNDNQQVSVLLWGKLRRFDDPAVGSAATDLLLTSNAGLSPARFGSAGAVVAEGQVEIVGVPAGAFPATVLEPFNPLLGAAGRIAQTAGSTADGGIVIGPEDELHVINSFDKPARSAFAPESALTLDEFFLRLTGSATLPGVDLTAKFESARFAVMGGLRRNTGLFIDFTPIPFNEAAEAYEDNYLTFSRNGLEFRNLETGVSQLRVGDMLLPLAVGPYRKPLETIAPVDESSYPTDANDRMAAYEAEWVTLGEALAVVAGYSDKVGPDPVSGIADPFDELRVINSGVTPVVDERVLDRGRLRLDAFAPYIDFNLAVGFDLGQDRLRGQGIPLALTIFDLAQAGGEMQEEAYGGIDRPVMGQVNINTAPPSVLRTLPGLFADTWFDIADETGVDPTFNANSWLWDRRVQSAPAGLVRDANTFEPEPLGNNTDYALDVASSVLAYRDAATGHVRLNRPDRPIGFGQPIRAYDMSVTGADLNGAPFDAQEGLALARTNTGIAGLRRTPGFGSVGELLAVRSNAANDPDQASMTWMGRDGRSLGAAFLNQTVGVASTDRDQPTVVPIDANTVNGVAISTIDPQLFGDLLLYREGTDTAFRVPGPDQVADDYDEQLVQINMLLNSASVSSDYFAAWIVVHGYAPEDVEVTDTDPLTPSFKGRYLLILDRSSVVRPGDRPRILASLELPYEVPTEYTVPQN